MAFYPQLHQLASLVDTRDPAGGFERLVVPYLERVWLKDYRSYSADTEIVETKTSGFHYLFDIAHERLIAAWGLSKGRHVGKRDASRMAGFPLSAGSDYHRGHAIPHTLGGPTDMNLVPQLGRINIGDFRPLEKVAVATPGSFYFTYWSYLKSAPTSTGETGQTPSAVDQGLLIAGQTPQVRSHIN